jgi:cell division protein FtsQ
MKNRRQPASTAPDVLQPKEAMAGAPPRWMGPLRNVAGFVLVAAVSLSTAWGVRHYLMTSPRFSLEQVVVENQRTRTQEGLLERAHLKMGQNVFSIDLEAARSGMLTDPYVESATLSRRLPDTLVVRIEERVPVAVVVVGTDPYLVTHEGVTFKRLELGDPPDLPVITGLSADLAETDHDAFADRVRRALDVALDYDQSALGPKMSLQEVHFEAGNHVTLSIGSQGRGVVSLVLGEAPWRRKLEEAGRVIAELERRGQKADVVMLDQSARPERVVARVR